MKHLQNFEQFNERLLMHLHQTIADRIAKDMSLEKEYTLNDVAKLIAKHGGVAAMHSNDVKEVMSELEKEGYKMKFD